MQLSLLDLQVVSTDLSGISYRTLKDPDKYITMEFDKDFFCDKAVDGTPMTNVHFVYFDGEYIGEISRVLVNDLWAYRLVGEDNEKYSATFEGASNSLVQWWKDDRAYWYSFFFVENKIVKTTPEAEPIKQEWLDKMKESA